MHREHGMGLRQDECEQHVEDLVSRRIGKPQRTSALQDCGIPHTSISSLLQIQSEECTCPWVVYSTAVVRRVVILGAVFMPYCHVDGQIGGKWIRMTQA